jgi:hypothetical protein
MSACLEQRVHQTQAQEGRLTIVCLSAGEIELCQLLGQYFV